MFKLDGLDHAALTVRDVERSAAWYVDILGLERMHVGMWGGVPTFVGTGGSGLALFPVLESGAGGPAIDHVAFRAGRAEFEKARAALKERGIAVRFADHEIAHSIYFHDPDGHEIEITTYDVGPRGGT